MAKSGEAPKPPVHPNLNMDFQERFEAQEENTFFADNRAMRTPVPGTIARGMLANDAATTFGRDASGAFVTTIPVTVDQNLLTHGQTQYNVYCTPCHGKAGDGNGVVMKGNYGFVPAPTYHSDRLRGLSNGYLYNVVVNGFNTMPGYGYHLSIEDRWSIVAYIRALQRSQYASASDVPADVRQRLQNTAQ